MELDHELVESAEDGDLVLALDADVELRKSSEWKQRVQQISTALALWMILMILNTLGQT